MSIYPVKCVRRLGLVRGWFILRSRPNRRCSSVMPTTTWQRYALCSTVPSWGTARAFATQSQTRIFTRSTRLLDDIRGDGACTAPRGDSERQQWRSWLGNTQKTPRRFCDRATSWPVFDGPMDWPSSRQEYRGGERWPTIFLVRKDRQGAILPLRGHHA